MNQSQTLAIVDLASGPARWWEVLAALGPLAVLIGAIVAAVVGGFTLRQRAIADALQLAQKGESDKKVLDQQRLADDRSEWWRRAQWALDRALSSSEGTKALGLATLEVLAHSSLARTEELELFDVAWVSVSNPLGESSNKHIALAPEPRSETRSTLPHRVQVAAARLQVTLDARLARPTPEEVSILAGQHL
ncbi:MULTISPECIES: hypothetical protein [Arthrobacter]|uniref:hypothetical protein n=1 Tax=unclassified Arthrobacter TaxID=235627 RepID=UPI0024BA819F|nr:hypothetical protein [Arthrobacter sp. H35-MC1]MDJ0315602.1 hypothetical protein [Arthrobacter sp. H35-MC1]